MELGEARQIPDGYAGSQDKEPGEWAKLLGEAPWKVAREGEMLNGKILPIFLAQEPVRELRARINFFKDGMREEERIRDKLWNVESAVMYCLGEI